MDRIIDYNALYQFTKSDKRGGGGRKTNLTPPLFIEVPVRSQVCERSCICMLALSTIFLLDFRTVVFIA